MSTTRSTGSRIGKTLVVVEELGCGSARIPRGFRGSAERSVNHGTSSVLRVGHQVGVDPQGEPRIGVAQILGQGPDRHPTIEQHRGVVVAQGVHLILTRGLETGLAQRGLPDLVVVVGPLDQAALPAKQDAAFGWVLADVLGNRHGHDIG